MPSVKIYGVPSCKYCDMAKEFVKDNKIDAEYIDLSCNQTLRDIVVEATGQRKVPIFEINEKLYVGFTENKERLAALAGA